jgi:hypothetical protein
MPRPKASKPPPPMPARPGQYTRIAKCRKVSGFNPEMFGKVPNGINGIPSFPTIYSGQLPKIYEYAKRFFVTNAITNDNITAFNNEMFEKFWTEPSIGTIQFQPLRKPEILNVMDFFYGEEWRQQEVHKGRDYPKVSCALYRGNKKALPDTYLSKPKTWSNLEALIEYEKLAHPNNYSGSEHEAALLRWQAKYDEYQKCPPPCLKRKNPPKKKKSACPKKRRCDY